MCLLYCLYQTHRSGLLGVGGRREERQLPLLMSRTALPHLSNNAAAPNLQTSSFKSIYIVWNNKLETTWQEKMETYEYYWI